MHPCIETTFDVDKWIISLPIDPVPASRPKFFRRGRMSRVYYGKKYTNFRNVANNLLEEATWPVELPLGNMVVVSADFIVAKPKTTKRLHPRGDVDNYFKTLDVLNKYVWFDDDQIVWASMSKRYGDVPKIIVEVKEIVGIPTTRALSELWV
mgnify:FL=1